MEFLPDHELKPYNSFHVKARARYFTRVASLAELQEALAFAQHGAMPFMVLGGGSNVLFCEDYPGLVIHLSLLGIKVLEEDEQSVLLQAAAGENWHDFTRYCLSRHYYGLENLSLIPGTVGAAPIQNIGAYGVELKDVLASVEVYDWRQQKTLALSREDCRFSYRDSIFKGAQAPPYIILAVNFRLSRHDAPNVGYPALKAALGEAEHPSAVEVSEAVCGIRRAKLPDPEVLGNAGSFFKNPIVSRRCFEALRERYPALAAFPEGDDRVKLAAGWLIEQAGWKGCRRGDAGVHGQQALVLVNHGDASGEDVLALAREVQASVEETFGITLGFEVQIMQNPSSLE